MGLADVDFGLPDGWVASLDPSDGALTIWAPGGATKPLRVQHLRSIPVREMQYEAAERRASQYVLAVVPDTFRGPDSYARLTRAIERVKAEGVQHPVAFIARVKEGRKLTRSDRDRWAMRAKRAKVYLDAS